MLKCFVEFAFFYVHDYVNDKKLWFVGVWRGQSGIVSFFLKVCVNHTECYILARIKTDQKRNQVVFVNSVIRTKHCKLHCCFFVRVCTCLIRKFVFINV
jgi:hypothetical protein